MQILTKLLIVLLTFYAFVVTSGEPLKPEVVAWIAEYENRQQATSVAYLYLNGIGAPEGGDVLERGRQKLVESKQKQALYEQGLSYLDSGGNDLDKLLVNEQSSRCQGRKISCYRSFIEDRHSLKRTSEHSTLSRRYQTYLQLDDYQTLVKADYLLHLPEYSYIANANFLLLDTVLKHQQNNQCELAQQILRQDISALRKQLVVSDSLIHSMVFTNLIAGDLEILNHIHQAGCTNINPVEPLTGDELSAYLYMQREFIFGKNMFTHIIDSNDWQAYEVLFTDPQQAIENKHSVINFIYDNYRPLADFSTIAKGDPVKAKQQILSIQQKIPTPTTFNDKLVFDSESVNFFQYMHRVYALNTKISLFNALVADNIESAQHPYLDTAVHLNDDNGAWCFDQSLTDREMLHCIGQY